MQLTNRLKVPNKNSVRYNSNGSKSINKNSNDKNTINLRQKINKAIKTYDKQIQDEYSKLNTSANSKIILVIKNLIDMNIDSPRIEKTINTFFTELKKNNLNKKTEIQNLYIYIIFHHILKKIVIRNTTILIDNFILYYRYLICDVVYDNNDHFLIQFNKDVLRTQYLYVELEKNKIYKSSLFDKTSSICLYDSDNIGNVIDKNIFDSFKQIPRYDSLISKLISFYPENKKTNGNTLGNKNKKTNGNTLENKNKKINRNTLGNKNKKTNGNTSTLENTRMLMTQTFLNYFFMKYFSAVNDCNATNPSKYYIITPKSIQIIICVTKCIHFINNRNMDILNHNIVYTVYINLVSGNFKMSNSVIPINN